MRNSPITGMYSRIAVTTITPVVIALEIDTATGL